jgi:hypothetical protein
MHKLQHDINSEQCVELDWCINVNKRDNYYVFLILSYVYYLNIP